MDALARSDELHRRGAKLRARSARIRAAAEETTGTSRRLIAAARQAHEAVLHAHGWVPPPAAPGSPRAGRLAATYCPRGDCSLSIVEPGSGEPTSLDVARFQALREQSRALVLAAEQARARVQATRAQILAGRARREVLHDSAFARLAAKQETMPVIEQAKGIVMAQRRCGPEEAFDVLRQVSQRTNVKLAVLAAQLVKAIASGKDGGNVRSISLRTGRELLP